MIPPFEPPRAASLECVCGRPLANASDAVCDACLFRAALGDERGEIVGEYELLQELAEGGTARVFLAKHLEQDELVALKLAKPEILVSDQAKAAFRAGIKIQGGLHHARIVRVMQSGTHEGQPFFVMQLLEGGTLQDEPNPAASRRPQAALGLMIKIARAVQFAHERGVQHCDLKPANILLDGSGEPFVSDFGLARVVARSGALRKAAFHGGTFGWMAPEQLTEQPLTMAADVFSLGAMLYWLLTGQPPFGDGSDYPRRVSDDPLVSASKLVPDLRSDVDAICRRALRKAPEQRYRSAAELADDLERARNGEPIEEERHRLRLRLVKWVRRHKLMAGVGIQLAMLFVYLPFMPLSVLREVKSTVKQQNAFSAVAQAGAVMNELRAFALRVEAMAREPAVLSLLDHPDVDGPAAVLGAHANALDFAFVFALDGTMRAAWPSMRPDLVRTKFAFRDYFQGQQRLASQGRNDVYVSRAFRSYVDNELSLGFAAPLFDAQGRHVGAVVGTTKTRATFGAVQMNCSGNGSCMTALLGPRDRDRPDSALPDALSVLAEPGLGRGEEKRVASGLRQQICAHLGCVPLPHDQFRLMPKIQPLLIEDYVDSVSHTRSIAALAPVGGTGLVVLVATPNDAVDALSQRIIARLKAFLWVPVLAGLLLLAGLLADPRRLLAIARKQAR
jgi:serine/threonine protein kinase